MHCPVCITTELRPRARDAGGPFTSHCEGCGGNHLSSEAYWRWREEQGWQNLPETPPGEAEPLEVGDVKRGKLCPPCGAILVPYRVGHGTGFSLDRCGQCGGVWFDKNEWETLRARNLHDDIHLIFSPYWQSAVAREEAARRREARLRQAFGDVDYEELRRVKAWLDAHPHSRELYAFLLSEREPG